MTYVPGQPPYASYNNQGCFYAGGLGLGYFAPDTFAGDTISLTYAPGDTDSVVLLYVNTTSWTGGPAPQTVLSATYQGIAFTRLVAPIINTAAYVSPPHAVPASPRTCSMEVWWTHVPQAVPGGDFILITMSAPVAGAVAATVPMFGCRRPEAPFQAGSLYTVSDQGQDGVPMSAVTPNAAIMYARATMQNVADEEDGQPMNDTYEWDAGVGMQTLNVIPSITAGTTMQITYNSPGVTPSFDPYTVSPPSFVGTSNSPNGEIVIVFTLSGFFDQILVSPVIATSLPCVPCCGLKIGYPL